MYQYQGMTDTIVAIITPVGVGGIGVIRLSGSEAFSILQKIFKSKKNSYNREIWKSFSTHYGRVYDEQSQLIDEVLVTWMPAPKSYTTEDVVEISCHGGLATVRALLETCLRCGARLAEPGEFTKRAFLNGRIDLAQAEAVMSVVHAKTQTALRVSERQLKGDLSMRLMQIREQLLEVLAHLEAGINFPEEQVEEKNKETCLQFLQNSLEHVKELLRTSSLGRVLKEGLRLVIAGKPNVGKSSLLNMILQEPRAIVTDIAGTTRDIIEEEVSLDGIPIHLVDTAGILSPRDAVEKEAVFRSQETIQTADMVLLVLDKSQPLDDTDCALFQQLQNTSTIVIINKIDLPSAWESTNINQLSVFSDIIEVSVLKKIGIENLTQFLIRKILKGHSASADGIVLSNLRHIQSLEQAKVALQRAQDSLMKGYSFEFITEDMKIAVNHLDAITGRFVDDDVIDEIFSKFCIGK